MIVASDFAPRRRHWLGSAWPPRWGVPGFVDNWGEPPVPGATHKDERFVRVPAHEIQLLNNYADRKGFGKRLSQLGQRLAEYQYCGSTQGPASPPVASGAQSKPAAGVSPPCAGGYWAPG